MASTSQPIALPSNNSHNADYSMAEGSYTGSSGFFNPASYTRHFLGSPISWLAGSFGVGSFGGGRFPMGSPTAQLLSSIDPNEFRAGKTPSSTDGSILNALNIFDRDRELCQNYTCCGLQLNDLHALLEHFEEVHIVVLDPTAPQPQAHIQIPFYPQSHDSDPSSSHHNNKPTPCPPYHQQRNQQQPYPAPFDADDMELELDLDNSTQPPPPPTPSQSSSHSSPSSGAPSPPDTPISTPLSAYPSPHAFIPHHLPQHNHVSAYISQPSSPLSNYDNSVSSTRHSSPTASTQRPNLNLNLSSFPRSHLNSPALVPNPEEVFNPYARFSSDYSSCMPGAQFNGANVDEASALHGVSPTQWQEQQNQQNQGQCVPPALLFSSSASVTPSSTPGGSRVPSPTTYHHHSLAAAAQSPISSVPASPAPLSKSHTAPNSGASTPVRTSSATAGATLSRPGSSLLLSKPFRCPKPNCNKSYKQANGLKYHMTHGSCNFAPPKDLEHVKDLLERKRRDKEREAGLTRSASCGSALGPAAPLSTTNEVMNEQGVLTYGELGNISETELREVEKEAEKRLRPFACGVGDCQRRYKNMNGLRYHYQHSGDHGAVGLALLASGQHECLLHGAQKRQQLQGGGTEAEREGRKRFLGGGKGSASVPVSRAGSASRTGTPSLPLPAVTVHYSTGTTPAGVPPTTAITTPIQATPVQPFPASSVNGNGVVSTPASPTFTAQQQQMAYQYAHVHAQMQRQYAVMQQQQQHAVQQAQVQAQQQAQQQAAQQQAAQQAQQQAAQQQAAQQAQQQAAQQQAQIAHQVHMQSSSPHMHVASPHHHQQQVHSPHSPSRSRYSHSPRHSHSSSQGSDSSYHAATEQIHFVGGGGEGQQQQQQQGFVEQQQGFGDQQQQNFVDQQQQGFVDQTQAQQQQQHFTDTHFAALYAQHQQQLYAAASGHAMDMS